MLLVFLFVFFVPTGFNCQESEWYESFPLVHYNLGTFESGLVHINLMYESGASRPQSKIFCCCNSSSVSLKLVKKYSSSDLSVIEVGYKYSTKYFII